MGFFDTIIIHAPLPLPDPLKTLPINWDKKEFQTKDLNNSLNEYEITQKGELIEKIVKRICSPQVPSASSKKPQKGWRECPDFLEENKYNKTINHHGKILVYTSGELNDTEDFWVEFEIYFSYGKLEKILQTKYEIQTSHKIAMKAWEKKQVEEKARPWNKFKHYAAYLGWKWVWRKIAKALQALSELLNKAQMIIYKHLT